MNRNHTETAMDNNYVVWKTLESSVYVISSASAIPGEDDEKKESCILTYAVNTRDGIRSFQTGEDVILFSRSTLHISGPGLWSSERLELSRFAMLWAFSGCQLQQPDTGRLVFPRGEKGYDGSNIILYEDDDTLCLAVQKNQNMMKDIIMFQHLARDGAFCRAINRYLSRQECYWLTGFLLQYMLDMIMSEQPREKLSRSCKTYGVSETQFRNLCRVNFSLGPKKLLRQWRAAYSVLQLIENNESIATTACNNGYSSASHFSMEVKQIFGLNPKYFKRIHRIFNEL